MNLALIITYSLFSFVSFLVGIIAVLEGDNSEMKTFRLYKLLMPTYYLGILISLPFRISIGKYDR